MNGKYEPTDEECVGEDDEEDEEEGSDRDKACRMVFYANCRCPGQNRK